MVNPKNGAYFMAIVTRCGRNLGENFIKVDEKQNEKSHNEQESAKWKKLEDQCIDASKF